MALKADGGAVFLDCEDISGQKKSADDIVVQHVKLVEKFAPDTNQLLGFVMDNPKANRNALAALELKYPRCVGLGCQAHSLNLLCKDMANTAKCPGTADVLAVVLKAALMVGDSSFIRTALQDIQRSKYGRVKAIAAHCPTRWGILVQIMNDLLDSKDALRELVESSGWPELQKGSKTASEITKNLQDGELLPAAACCFELLLSCIWQSCMLRLCHSCPAVHSCCYAAHTHTVCTCLLPHVRTC